MTAKPATATLEFVLDSDDERLARAHAHAAGGAAAAEPPAEHWRTARLGLGFTAEMHRAQQRKDQDAQKLQRKLLGLKRHSEPDPDSEPAISAVNPNSDSEPQLKVVAAKAQPKPAAVAELQGTVGSLSQSQKKRMRQKKNRLSRQD